MKNGSVPVAETVRALAFSMACFRFRVEAERGLVFRSRAYTWC